MTTPTDTDLIRTLRDALEKAEESLSDYKMGVEWSAMWDDAVLQYVRDKLAAADARLRQPAPERFDGDEMSKAQAQPGIVDLERIRNLQAPERHGLTDEQIYDLIPTCSITCPMDALWFARAIERAHGICATPDHPEDHLEMVDDASGAIVPWETLARLREALDDLTSCGKDAWGSDRPCVRIGAESVGELDAILSQKGGA